MRVLVAVASKHGSTLDIAEAIATELKAAGVETDIRDVHIDIDPRPYDAAIIGSAVYAGSWLSDATAFIEAKALLLRDKPVWLFSSGPLGDHGSDKALDQKKIEHLMQMSGAREHRVFDGMLDPKNLGFGEKLVTKVVHAPLGDFRDWNEIKAWAGDVRVTLSTLRASIPVSNH